MGRLQLVSEEALKIAIEATNGNTKDMCKLLDIKPSTVYSMLNKYPDLKETVQSSYKAEILDKVLNRAIDMASGNIETKKEVVTINDKGEETISITTSKNPPYWPAAKHFLDTCGDRLGLSSAKLVSANKNEITITISLPELKDKISEIDTALEAIEIQEADIVDIKPSNDDT